jgi:hypothetical protein
VRKLADVEPVELPPKDTTFPAAPGIYAVYDKEGDLQYVGLTRRVSTSLDTHLKENSELCGSVKVLSLSLSLSLGLVLSFELSFVFEETKKCLISSCH